MRPPRQRRLPTQTAHDAWAYLLAKLANVSDLRRSKTSATPRHIFLSQQRVSLSNFVRSLVGSAQSCGSCPGNLQSCAGAVLPAELQTPFSSLAPPDGCCQSAGGGAPFAEIESRYRRERFPARSSRTPERRSLHRLRPERTPSARRCAVYTRDAARLPAGARADRRQGRLRRRRMRRLRRAAGRPAPTGPAARTASSTAACMLAAAWRPDSEIYTVESLAADGELAEAQQAMAAAGGSQCGYCTPGFVMSLFAEQYRPGRVGPVRSAGAGRQPLPLHRLSSDSRRGAVARAGAGRRISRSARAARAARCERGRALRATSRGRRRVDECCRAARGRSRTRRSSPAASDLGVESNLRGTALAAPGQRRSASTSCASSRRRRERVRIGAALPLTDIGRRWRDAPDVVRASGWRSSPRRRSGTARRSAATSRRRRRSATPRRCCWRSMPSVHVAGPRRAGARCRWRRSSPATGRRRSAPARLLTADRDPEAAARSACASTRSRSAGSTTSARSRRRWRSIATSRGRVQPRARSRSAAWPRRRCASREAEDARRWASSGTRPPWTRVQQVLDRDADADRATIAGRRSTGSDVSPAAWSRSSGGRRGHDARVGPAGAARERARPRHGRGALHRRSGGRASRTCCTPGRCWRRTRMHASPRSTRRRRSTMPGVVTVLTGADVPGEGDTGADRARRAAVPARGACSTASRWPGCWARRSRRRSAARRASRVEYEPLPAILTIEQAIAADSFLTEPLRLARGDMSALESSALRFDGRAARSAARSTSISRRSARSPGSTRPAASSCTRPRSIPSETQEVVARVLGLATPSGHRRVPAHGRRVRRQGSAGQHVGGDRGARRVEDAAAGARAADARSSTWR